MTILLAGCVRAASSVDPKPAPSFELQVINSRPCPTATDPQLACFVVKIHNRSNKDGMGWEGKGREGKGREGTCVVHHYARGGEALVGEGPSFQTRLRPSEAVRAQGQAHLTAAFASLRFTSYCNPGPRL